MSEPFFQESTPVPGRRHVAREGATIGRGSADIVLIDPQISRAHARLHVEGPSVRIEDLGSRNGTYLNEVRIEGDAELKEGDMVRMGDTVWRFVSRATAAAASPERLSEVSRGDVPAPDLVPSGIRRAPPAVPAGAVAPPSFTEPRTVARSRRGSAARSATATLISYGVVIATAIAVVLYLALR